MPTLETARLRLRPFRDADLDGYAAMLADPDVVEYLGAEPASRDDAWRHMALLAGHEVFRGWTQSAVEEKATGRFLGRAGLWRPEGWPGLEVGWAFAREAWGHGYATEAALAWRDWAFAHCDADELISVIHRDNARSAAVARRIGHQPLREDIVRGYPVTIWGQPFPRG